MSSISDKASVTESQLKKRVSSTHILVLVGVLVVVIVLIVASVYSGLRNAKTLTLTHLYNAGEPVDDTNGHLRNQPWQDECVIGSSSSSVEREQWLSRPLLNVQMGYGSVYNDEAVDKVARNARAFILEELWFKPYQELTVEEKVLLIDTSAGRRRSACLLWYPQLYTERWVQLERVGHSEARLVGDGLAEPPLR